MSLPKLSIVLAIALVFVIGLSSQPFADMEFNTKQVEKNKASSSKPNAKQKSTTKKRSVSTGKKSCRKLKISSHKNLPTATVGIDYKTQLKTNGGQKPIYFAKAPSLPYGLQLSIGGQLVSKITKPGDYQFKIEATDSCNPKQTVLKKFYLTVRPKIKIDAASAKSVYESKSKLKQPRKKKLHSVAHLQNKPKITSLITSPPNLLKPNGMLRLKGIFFGDNPGKVYMKGNSIPQMMLFLYGWKGDEIKCRVDHNTDVFQSQEIDIWIETSDKKISNVKKIAFEGRVEYTCDGDIIRGSDGSAKVCTPYRCYIDPDGFGIGIACETSCVTGMQCASGYRCSSAGTCVVATPPP